jgi:hypothetical protein
MRDGGRAGEAAEEKGYALSNTFAKIPSLERASVVALE